jgi:NADH dehydrogenase (ubiquinone) flavoprotein 2
MQGVRGLRRFAPRPGAAVLSGVAARPVGGARLLSSRLGLHKPVKGNEGDEVFDFTVANYDRVAAILSKYPTNYKQSACIPLLDLAQRQNNNYLTVGAITKVAEILGCNPMRVYEVASFYTMFNREKVSR